MEKIEVDNIVVNVVRKNIKNLHLRVYRPTGSVRISAPPRINDETIRSFIVSKIGWIKKHQSKFEAHNRGPDREFVSGESHKYQGQSYLLNVIYHDARPKVEIRDRIYIDLYLKLGSNQLQRQKVMTEWYRSELKKQIPGLIEKWEHIVGVEINDWCVKKMKTRWGACNRQAKRIWINLELAKKPLHCLEFIVVHELTHLIERYHNDRFKALMDGFMPQWRIYKEELDRFGISHND
jgi:predicted metal-dependent hydrolase